MNTEREMLEAAARAMGWEDAVFRDMQGWGEARYGLCVAMWVNEEVGYWNPLVGSHDALELAAALRISVEHNHPQDHEPWVSASVERIGAEGVCMGVECFMEDVPDEAQRADRMRLAILRCAAAQAPKPVGTGGPENGPEIAEARMDTGFHRGRGVAADLVLLEGGEACPR